MNPELDVLVVSPHPDDAEISVGGTLLVCKQQGLRVGVIDLTNGEPTPHGTLAGRSAETRAATELLALDWRENLGLPNRQLVHSLEARQALANVFRRTRPQIILAPYWEDVHPDHSVASELADAARFWAKLSRTDEPGQIPLAGDPFWPPKLYYFWSIHLRNHPQPSFVVDVSSVMDQKLAAIRCYESQMLRGRSEQFPTVLDDIRDRNRYWGWSIGRAYGEPFASRESIGVPGLNTLL